MPYYDPVAEIAGGNPFATDGNAGAEIPANYTADLPALGQAIQQKKGLLGPAIKSGMYDIGGALGAGVGAVGGALGVDPLRDWGVSVSDAMQRRSQAAGRPELEAMPWSDEWGRKGQTLGDIPAWAGYQIAKQIPQMGLAVAGGGLAGAALKGMGVVAPGAEFAASLPRWAGGSALEAGASQLERDAALKAGQDMAQRFMGTTAAGMPQAAGSMYQQEVERARAQGEDPSQGGALAALGLSPVYSALDAATPTETVGMVKRGLAGNLPRRLATAALSEGAQEMVQEGLQTGMEMSFRPDLPMADKAQQIIDSALVGGLVGGAFGSVGGIRRLKSAQPQDVSNENLEGAVDTSLQQTPRVEEHTPPYQPPLPMEKKEFSTLLGTLKGGQGDIDPSTLGQVLYSLGEAADRNELGGIKQQKRKALTVLGLMDEKTKKVARSIDDVVATLTERKNNAATEADAAQIQTRIAMFEKLRAAQDAYNQEQMAAAGDAGDAAAAAGAPLPGDAETMAPPPAPPPVPRTAAAVEVPAVPGFVRGADVPDALDPFAEEDAAAAKAGEITEPSLRQKFLAGVPEAQKASVEDQLRDAEGVAASNPAAMTPENIQNWANNHGVGHLVGPLGEHLEAIANETLAKRAEPAGETFEQRAQAAGRPAAAVAEGQQPAKEPIADDVRAQFVISPNGKVITRNSAGGGRSRLVFQERQATFTDEAGKKSPPVKKGDDLSSLPEHLREAVGGYLNTKDETARAGFLTQAAEDWMRQRQSEEKARAIQVGSTAATNVGANAQTGGSVGEGNTAGQAPAASVAAKPAKPAKQPTQKQKRAEQAEAKRVAAEQARQDAIGEVYTSGRWGQVEQMLRDNVAYEDIAKKTGIPFEKLQHAIRWINNPGDTREWMGYGRTAAEKGWIDPKTKEIALAFLDGKISPQDAIAEAKTALADVSQKDRYQERLQLVANLVKDATNRMKSRDTKVEDTEDLSAQYNPLTDKHQDQFRKLGETAQKAMDRMIRSGKTAGQIYDVMREDFRAVSFHVTPGLINDYAQSIGEKLPPTPIPQTESSLRKGNPEQQAAERKAYENRPVRRGNWNGINGVRFGDKAKFHMGVVGEPILTVRDQEARVWRSETLGDLHKGLLKISSSKPLRQLAPLIQRIADVPVVYVAPGAIERMYPGSRGFYDPEQKMIVLPDLEYLTPNEEAHRAMHEAVHAAMHEVIDADPDARAELMRIANAVKKSGLHDDPAAYQDAHEFLSEALSNPDLQKAMEKVKMPSQLTGWKAFVAKVMDWLGLRGSPNALEEVMRVQKQLEGKRLPFDYRKEVQDAYGKPIEEMLSDGQHAAENKRLLAMTARRVTDDVDSRYAGVFEGVDRAMENTFGKGPADLTHKKNSVGLWWSSFGHILQRWGRLFGSIDSKENPVRQYGDAMRQRSGITQKLAGLFSTAQDRLEELDKNNPSMKFKDNLTKLMGITTEFGLDPDKKWDEIKNSPRIKKLADPSKHEDDGERLQKLKELHAEAVRLKNHLGQNARTRNGSNIYKDYRNLNDLLIHSSQAVMLYNLVSKDPYFAKDTKYAPDRPALDRILRDPVEDFLAQPNIHDDPSAAAEFWRKETQARMDVMNRYLAHMQANKARLSKEDWSAYETSKNPIASMLRDVEQQLSAMKEAPYFHLGRHGQFVARFDVRATDKTKGEKDKFQRIVDPDAIKEVSERLAKIHPDAVIDPLNDRTRVMIRFESKDQRDRVIAELKKMQAEGLVEGTEADLRDEFRGEAQQPAWLQHYINAIKSSTALTPNQKQQMVSIATTTWLDQLSDTAVARVLAQRQYIPGYNRDMLRNFAFRAEVGINSLANLSVSAKINTAFERMETIHNEETLKDPDKADQIQQVRQELRQRDADRPMVTGKDWIDTWRSINQAFFLGMSPAYTLVNMSQLGVMLLPELAKKHGFVKAAKIMASVTPKAFKIMRETWAEGRSVSLTRAMDSVITGGVLARSGLDKDMHDFLTRIVNSGNIDLGSPMREMGRAAKGVVNDPIDNALRYASAMGYYSETFSRLIAAMSAHELSKGSNMTDEQVDIYAARVLDDAMLNYANWYTARATGKMGILGKFTPVPASFQQYTLQVTQKLYRELADAFEARRDDEPNTKEGNDAYEQRVKGARKFLIGHATVLGLLAGSLGMPFSTVALALVDKLREAFGDDDEPPDTKADYENFLTLVFGKDAAEMIAHGLPRGLGGDISGRIGEQDLAPLSRFFADKRKMKDAAEDLIVRSTGSPVSMLLGIGIGGSEMLKGNYMDGLQQMVPNSIKGALKAYDMATKGYHDANGTPLPITADILDIVMQVLGITPADKAQYTEGNLVRASRKTALAERASQLRNTALAEMQEGGITPETMAAMQRFDGGSHSMAVLPTLASAFQRRATQAVMARQFGLPLGADIKDAGERERLGFLNFNR